MSESQPTEPRSGGIEVSPGRKPRVSWGIERSRGAATPVPRFLLSLLVLGILASSLNAQHQSENHTPEFRRMQQKIQHLRENAAKSKPDPKSTELTEPEVNAYFNEGGVKLPKGVSNVHLTSQPGVIDAHAQVDFEAITNGRGS